MKNYILGRIVRSIISILCVVSIAIVMVYTMIPKEKMFQNDVNVTKLKGDDKIVYKYQKWEQVGYLDYVAMKDICALSDDYTVCMTVDGPDRQSVINDITNDGYTVETLPEGTIIAYRQYRPLELIVNFLTSFISIDNPNYVNDPSNPNLERGYYIEADHNGIPAIQCSGCEYRYQVYFNSTFPFIHQNAVKLSFGISYPEFNGYDTMDVISDGQGSVVKDTIEYETGKVSTGSENLHTCVYKNTDTLDRFDKEKFETNYANCKSYMDSPSMINTSYLFGIMSLIIAYAVALPAGILMAQKKDKWQDKLGIVYINIMIATPSLAFIYFFRVIGMTIGLPDKFPYYGAGDVRSYILPIIILGLLNTSGLMIWMRRYMVDQSNSDYVKFARAKGLSQKEIFNNHILKNAIIPIVNGIPGSIVLCISGSVITESVFAIPGMGKMLPDAIKTFNNSMIVTLTFIFTALSIFSLLAGDILMTFVDPRIQLSSKGETR